jgi:hypothetical protein
MINGCFISYSWKDAKFVDKLRDHLVGVDPTVVSPAAIWVSRRPSCLVSATV